LFLVVTCSFDNHQYLPRIWIGIQISPALYPIIQALGGAVRNARSHF
jgi:hypothetical protein